MMYVKNSRVMNAFAKTESACSKNIFGGQVHSAVLVANLLGSRSRCLGGYQSLPITDVSLPFSF